MKLQYKDTSILIDDKKHDITLNYDRCFGRIIRKYDAMIDENIDLMDEKKYGLRTLLIMEIIKKGTECTDNISVGDYVVVSAGHPVQVNITLNYLINDMGDEYAVVPENLMMFKLPCKDESETEILLKDFVTCKFDEILNVDESEAFDIFKTLGTMTRFKIFKIIDSNNTEVKNGEFYIMDKLDMDNTFPIANDLFMTSVNNFKIRVEK